MREAVSLTFARRPDAPPTLRGVGAQHIAEQDLLELLRRDVRRLDRGVAELDRLPRRRGVVGGFKVRKRKFHARVALA